MKLYEIDQRILKLLEAVDEETGELPENVFDELEALAFARNDKIEGVGLYIKTLRAEAEAIKAEKLALADRQSAKERKVERLTEFLKFATNGQKFETPRLTVSFRKSTAVEVVDPDLIPDYFKEPQPDKILKTEIKKQLSQGIEVPGAVLDVRQNIQIK